MCDRMPCMNIEFTSPTLNAPFIISSVVIGITNYGWWALLHLLLDPVGRYHWISRTLSFARPFVVMVMKTNAELTRFRHKKVFGKV